MPCLHLSVSVQACDALAVCEGQERQYAAAICRDGSAAERTASGAQQTHQQKHCIGKSASLSTKSTSDTAR